MPAEAGGTLPADRADAMPQAVVLAGMGRREMTGPGNAGRETTSNLPAQAHRVARSTGAGKPDRVAAFASRDSPRRRVATLAWQVRLFYIDPM